MNNKTCIEICATTLRIKSQHFIRLHSNIKNSLSSTDDDENEDMRENGRFPRLASLRHGVSDATTRVGTSFYMSPEIMQGWARYDSKVDLYRYTPSKVMEMK